MQSTHTNSYHIPPPQVNLAATDPSLDLSKRVALARREARKREAALIAAEEAEEAAEAAVAKASRAVQESGAALEAAKAAKLAAAEMKAAVLRGSAAEVLQGGVTAVAAVQAAATVTAAAEVAAAAGAHAVGEVKAAAEELRRGIGSAGVGSPGAVVGEAEVRPQTPEARRLETEHHDARRLEARTVVGRRPPTQNLAASTPAPAKAAQAAPTQNLAAAATPAPVKAAQAAPTQNGATVATPVAAKAAQATPSRADVPSSGGAGTGKAVVAENAVGTSHGGAPALRPEVLQLKTKTEHHSAEGLERGAGLGRRPPTQDLFASEKPVEDAPARGGKMGQRPQRNALARTLKRP